MVELKSKTQNDWTSKSGLDFKWVTRCKLGRVIETKLTDPKIGDTLILDPYTDPKPLQTEPITEILESSDTKVIFNTQNMEYKFFTHLYFQDLYEELNSLL